MKLRFMKKRNKSVDIDNNSIHDDQEDTRSVGTQESGSSHKIDKATTVDLSLEGINNIEELLESLSRRVSDVEQNDRDFERVENVVDNDDSARAESVVSLGSSTSSRIREDEQERVLGGENLSLIRRQSVIIEGLTLETDELRKKCQVMEEKLLVTPVDEDLSQKLEQVEEKLEETETYCYQVVEENVELKSEMEALESEISEVQDTFRDKDAKEFKKVKWELENLSKTCRNLQIKLGKAQAKASRLRQEKEEIEDEQREQREQTLWKTSAVAAVAALAAYHLLSRYK
jgi:DNA repair exonuclease SbcCD ATPase subunit